MSDDNAIDKDRMDKWPEGRKLTDLTPKSGYRSNEAPARSYKRGSVSQGDMNVEGRGIEVETQLPAPVHRHYDRYGSLSGEQLAEIISFCQLREVGQDNEGAMSWNQAARELGVNEMALKRIVENYRVGVILSDEPIAFNDLQVKVLQLQYRVLNSLGIINEKAGAKLIERLDNEGEYPIADKELIKLYEIGIKGTSGVMKGLNEAAAISIEANKEDKSDSEKKIIELEKIFSSAKKRMEDGENIDR